ncbi:ABC transporter ATP-binding protein [Parasalinivibrio latis]|uniref:dipeptide ABC transporter ATP-binding protein n=1 Tax=Parasalinivibrio latis TaxID=2952610 RepID=UPI0030E1B3B3
MEHNRLVDIRDLSISFEQYGVTKQVLHKVSLSVRPGQRVALVGETGSGKSITSKALIGNLPERTSRINGGDIEVEGRSVFTMGREEREGLKGTVMSMIQQDPLSSFNPVFRIGTHLDDVLRYVDRREGIRRSKAERKLAIYDALRKVRLEEVERVYRSYPFQLSGGMRQRVLIAMALLHPTKLLIADEPGTALDVTTQAEIIKLINTLVEQEHLALLLISHNLGVVRQASDYVYVMQHGRIVEHGQVEALFAFPCHPYTKRLFSAIPPLYGSNVHTESRPDSQPLLTVRNLNKEFVTEKGLFGRPKSINHAVKGVSFNVRLGDIYGLAGESGSGKTTVARMLLGLEPATSGELVFGDESFDEYRARHGAHVVQMVYQNPGGSLNPKRSVREILEVPLKFIAMLKGEALDKRVSELLNMVELTENHAELYPGNLSGGQKQRVAIARALAANPKILVLDEPTSALDVSVQKNVIELLRRLHGQLGLTYIFISHDLSLMRNFCTQIAVMLKGEVVEEGKPVDVFALPEHPYTRRLIQAIPVLSEEEQACKPVDLNVAGPV